VGTQLGFAEALVNRKAGKNRRLEAIDRQIDWAALALLLPGPRPASSPGRPAYPALPMFKAILLAQWYQLSDPALEEALSDRLSFRRFCGFALDAATPDETTLCRFRNELARESAGERLMAELERQLGARKLLVKDGTMIDATLIEAQAARPKDKKEERTTEQQGSTAPQETVAGATSQAGDAATAVAGERPQAGAVALADSKDASPAAAGDAAAAPAPKQESKREKKKYKPAFDRDARFARKGGKSYYGYKAHVAVDRGSGLIRRACMTPANVHDTVPADGLVMGDEKAVYADKAYATHARRASLKARGIKDRIMHRANKHQPTLPRWQKKRNELIASARAPVERTFGIWRRAYGYARVRYFSLVANAFELQMKCFAFNLRRLVVLTAA
jgi:transposase, IS5 family